MKKLIGLVLIAVLPMLLGCAGTKSRENDVAILEGGKILQASGYGQVDDRSRASFSQNWQSTQQSAKLNAYRGLADQLYYEPLGEGKTVGSQVVSHEVYRVYLDTYLRQARATDYRAVKDNLKTTLELKLTPRFYQCMKGDVARVRQCIEEDDKLAFTRLGYKTAKATTVNLACGTSDCSDQFSVQGFSKNPNDVDDFLLDVGLYDTEWTVNTGLRLLFNYLLINGFVNVW